MSLRLLGCGVLRKEVSYLIAKNHWDVAAIFLPTILHDSFSGLNKAIEKIPGDVLLYGQACLPNMVQVAAKKKAALPGCQNCFELLLGYEDFFAELSQGAYFLLEDYVQNWPQQMEKYFGPHPDILREIFKTDRKYILALNTPCSGDYRAKAEAIAQELDVPLKWKTIDLKHLERELQNLLTANPLKK